MDRWHWETSCEIMVVMIHPLRWRLHSAADWSECIPVLVTFPTDGSVPEPAPRTEIAEENIEVCGSEGVQCCPQRREMRMLKRSSTNHMLHAIG